MNFDLDQRRARLSVGDFSDFSPGPKGSTGGGGGLWRAQLGSRWHRELRAQAATEGIDALFELAIEGAVLHRGWTVELGGRIDQVVRKDGATILREIKTVTEPLPAPEDRLRTDYPAYFVQLAAYAALCRSGAKVGPDGGLAPERCELVFVEAGSGLAQTVALTAGDEALYEEQLARVVEFLDFRRRARERLRGLRFRPPFAELRAGQETLRRDLEAAVRQGRSAILLEAPTGFGKTGVLLEFALGELRDGRFDRVLYLTGKSTGQLQVAATLAAMTAPGPDLPPGPGVAAWQVRNKSEHCVNSVFHCVKDACSFLDGIESRWRTSGLARFYLFDGEPRDLGSLREAGRAARICPYEITRAALAYNDIWIGDYNYVFAPDSRGLFREQPGYEPGKSLLLIDEAHNLPSRAADAHSHEFSAGEALEVCEGLRRIRAPARLATGWTEWSRFLDGRPAGSELGADERDEARQLLDRLAADVAGLPVDYAALGPDLAQKLWRPTHVAAQLDGVDLPRLWWSPRAGELHLTCLDAAAAIGAELREFGGVILATATPGPLESFAEACGLKDPAASVRIQLPPPSRALRSSEEAREGLPDRLGELNRKQTRRVFAQLTSGTGLLRAEESRAAGALLALQAATPWRDGAYDTAVDLRVDTTFQQRERHRGTTAATIAALSAAAEPGRAVAVFFPSYSYAEAIVRELERDWPDLRIALQPRRRDLSGQAAWVEDALTGSDALFLVLGSSFTESIDLLGGRVSHAMVVGPALPEVNSVQRAKLAAFAPNGRDAAFDRTYRIPGMQKVNQALGRLVRAPGQRAKVLLHCRRFAEAGYSRLLAPEYRTPRRFLEDDELRQWLAQGPEQP